MSRVMLDTSAYSAYMCGDERIRSALQTADEVFFNPVVIGELTSGFVRGKHVKKNKSELDAFLSSPRVGILIIDEETADRYAAIVYALRRQGTPVPANDMWIAASAMQYGLKILTCDDHFKRIPQIITIET